MPDVRFFLLSWHSNFLAKHSGFIRTCDTDPINRIVCSVFLMMYLYTEELHTICKLWNSFFTVQNLHITKTSTYTKQSLHRRDVRGDAMTPERVLARNSNYVEKSVIFFYLG